MSAAEKPPNLEELDPRYPLLREYFDRGWTLIRLYGVAETSTAEHPVCLCKDGAGCGTQSGKHPHGTYKEANGSAYVRNLEEAVRKLPPGKRWNVGLPHGYGKGAGWVSLDTDSDTALERIRREYGFDPLQAKAWASTGRSEGGYHSVYKLTPEQLEKAAELGLEQGSNKWAVPDVDVRVGGTNGLIVIEPSIHYSGRLYKWQELGEPDYAPEGFFELMATRENLRSRKPAEKAETKPSRANVIPFPEPEHDRKGLELRAKGAIEAAASRIARQTQPGRHDTNAGQAWSLGVILSDRPKAEQARGLSELLAAFARQERHAGEGPKSAWEKSEEKGIEEQFEEGLRAGAAGDYTRGKAEPIPANPPENAKPSSSSSAASSEEPADDPDAGFRPGLRWVSLSKLDGPKRVEWLEGDIAEGRIPRGELSIIMGEPGVGKGSITAQIVAEVTNAGRVVIVSAPEDDLERVTLPRYLAAGAKLENIIAVGYAEDDDGPWTPLDVAAHAEELLEKATEHAAAAIVLDPFEEHLAADAKVERETRLALRRLLNGCRSIGCSVLGIDHLNRMNSSSGYKRAGGSSAKYKLARSVMIAAKQAPPEGQEAAEAAMKPAEVVLIHDKCNVGGIAHGLRFELCRATITGTDGEPVITVSARLLGETTLTASEVLSEEAQAQTSEVRECSEWLRGFLELKGYAHPLEETRKAAREVNPDWKADTLKQAVKLLGGNLGPVGVGGGWAYKLPAFVPLGEDRH